jgi:RNA polymerase sigma-70 factor (ECF subfamily)
MQEEADDVLVVRSRAGDELAFAELVRRHMRSAYAVALSVVLEPSDAEDVVQDSFIAALERLDSCQPDRFAAWLMRIVRNRAISLQRRRRVRKSEPLEWAGGVVSSHNPAADLDRLTLRARLLEAMEPLPERQREVLLLHDLEGWRHREIGDALGMKEGTVRYTLFQARRAVRERLGIESVEGTRKEES